MICSDQILCDLVQLAERYILRYYCNKTEGFSSVKNPCLPGGAQKQNVKALCFYSHLKDASTTTTKTN